MTGKEGYKKFSVDQTYLTTPSSAFVVFVGHTVVDPVLQRMRPLIWNACVVSPVPLNPQNAEELRPSKHSRAVSHFRGPILRRLRLGSRISKVPSNIAKKCSLIFPSSPYPKIY